MNLLRNPGLELPIISPETPVAWTSVEIATAAQGGGNTFVRRMALEFPRQQCNSLKEALGIADELIESAAAHIGVKAIRRAWGLYADPGNLRANQLDRIVKNGLVPKDHFLVAEVPIVSPASALSLTQVEALAPKISSYYRRSRASYTLGDLGSRQCVYGTLADGSGGTSPETWLVDAEPRVRGTDHGII